MRLAITLFLATAIQGPPALSAPALSSEGQALRQELVEMARADLDARKTLDRARVATTVRRNVARLKQIIDRYGWPGTSLVGPDGAKAVWLLVQHADLDAAFQQRCLALMEAAVQRHEASARDLAYLTDRVLASMGKPQRYGTQLREQDGHLVPLPIEDPQHLEERRQAAGLDSFREYQARMDRRFRAHQAGAPGAHKLADPGLRDQLLALCAADRKEGPAPSPARQARQEAMRRLLERTGWPSATLAGEDGAEAAWSLVRDGDPALRAQALPLLEAAYQRKEARADWYATLVDLTQADREGKQRYGTLTRWDGAKLALRVPLDEPDHVDDRRKELGLPPLHQTMAAIELARSAHGKGS
jgi:hypothetical protein